MLSHDLIAMSWKFAEFAQSGCQMEPETAADFSRRFRAMAADASALERATLLPEACNLAADYQNVVVFNPARRRSPAGGPQGGNAA